MKRGALTEQRSHILAEQRSHGRIVARIAWIKVFSNDLDVARQIARLSDGDVVRKVGPAVATVVAVAVCRECTALVRHCIFWVVIINAIDRVVW